MTDQIRHIKNYSHHHMVSLIHILSCSFYLCSLLVCLSDSLRILINTPCPYSPLGSEELDPPSTPPETASPP